MKKLFTSVAFWIVLIVVIVVAVLASQRLKQAEEAKKIKPRERPPMPVRAVKAHRGSVQEFVMGEGTARTVRREFLNFEASGKVIFIDKDLDGGELREGSQVYGPESGQQFGQLLAQLDQREILAALSMDKAALEQARQNVNVAYATVTQAENEYDLAEADFDRFTRHSEEGTTLALHEENVTQANETVTAAEAAVTQAESDFKLAKTELARAKKLSKSGVSLKTYKEALNQARQNVTSAEAGVAKAQNDYDLAKTNFEKAEKLHKEGIIAKTKYDEAKTLYRNAEASLKTAKANFQAARSQAKNAANELEKAKINVPVTELATAQARYRSAEAAVKTAKANLKTTKSRAKTASTQLDQAKIDVPIVEYETAKAKYLNAEAALETAVANLHVAHSQVEASLIRLHQTELNLERTSIFAPFDGIITYLNIKIGNYVTPQTMDKSTEQAMMETAPIVLIDPATYEITLNLPAYAGSAVQVKQSAFIVSSTDTFPEEPEEFQVEHQGNQDKPEFGTTIEPIPMVQGKVYSVSPSISPGGRSIQIKIRTTEGTEYLQDGMFVSAKIIVAEKSNVVTLPGNCLIFRRDKAYVFVADSQTGIVTRRPVMDGIGNIRKWEVIDGVKEGEFVVTEGRYRLVDGAKVEIIGM